VSWPPYAAPVRPAHLPTAEQIANWPAFSPEQPLRILASGCLAGEHCGYDGTSYGEHATVAKLFGQPNVQVFNFCPEDFSFGTPRALCNLHGGDGFDVLDGHAQVQTEDGENWTDGMTEAAKHMLELATAKRVHVAVLMDISGACGSQVIYDGPRHLKVYRRGPGVCAALLIRGGIPVVSQRDLRTLALIFCKLGHEELGPPVGSRDHHESEWYREYFGAKSPE
jgi:uncharacterized protein YbbK (DUF523 family)